MIDVSERAPAATSRRALREAERRQSARTSLLRMLRPDREAPDHQAPAALPIGAASYTPGEAEQPGGAPTIAEVSAAVASTTESTAGGRLSMITTAAGSVVSKRATRWVPRFAVLASLAVATTGVPLSGLATTAAEPEPTETATVFAATSALDVLAAEQVDGTDVFDDSASLAADPLAAARALLTAGRTDDRDVVQCGSSELEANGQVSAGTTTEPVQVMMPLTTGSYRVTSQYGYRWGGKHEGVDMAAPAGTPIHAVAAGEVTYIGYGLAGRSGMIIVLKHDIDGQTFWTWYIHMYRDGIFVNVGDQVNAGEVIGEVGSYGNSTGPHLHLEVHVDGEYTTVDPVPWLEQHNAAPLTAENLACAAG